MSARRASHLAELGVHTYRRRGAVAEEVTASAPAIAAVDAPAVPNVASVSTHGSLTEVLLMDWETLRNTVAGCGLCGLQKTRKQAVFGVGHQRAEWFIVGEAPGADEDRLGEPFVGRAGQLLDAMLRAIDVKRGENAYIGNILKCLRYNALVQLENGSWERIGRLVRSRYSGRVMSVDAMGQIVPRRVTAWYESPVGDRRVYRLSYRRAKNAGSSRVGIQLTGDHPVLTRRGFVPVADLMPADQVATGQGLSALAFDVVSGTLLGDGYIQPRTSLLSFSHSARQREYANFKADLLAELKPQVSEMLVAAVSGGSKTYPVVQVFTRAHRALRILREDFYSPRKRVPSWMATQLNDRMLAFWFMDDGYMRIRPPRQPSAEIATCGFAEKDLAVLVAGLERLGLPVSVRGGRLHFDVASSRLLSERIAPYVPPGMRYKLHPEIAERVPFDPALLQAGPVRVLFDDVDTMDVSQEKRCDKTFFCIDVEETHNFVTAGGVVHNCRPPGNRDPRPEEAESCRAYLDRQIALVQPRILLAVGRIAAQNLLHTDTPIGKMRGRTYSYGNSGIPVVVTYHPAYLLRSPGEKRKAWIDLKFARDVVRRGNS